MVRRPKETPHRFGKKAASSGPGLVQWQPRETAPTDGTVVMVAWPERGPYRAVYETYHPNAPGAKCWRDPETGHKLGEFTHWAPLLNLPPMG